MAETDTEVTNEVLRSLLTDAFGRDDLISLCFDRFPELYEDAKGWTYQALIRELISYAKRRGWTADLLEAVKQRNPEQFERYTPYLAKSFYLAGPGLARITVEIPNDNELIGDVLRSLASLLETQGRIHCVKVEMGSLHLTIILPAYAIDRLLALYEAGDKRLTDLKIGSVDLLRPDLRDITLHRADLRKAQLGGADLRNADLHGAYLNGANLSGADLQNANLRNAKLVGADLHKASLVEADLTNADLRQADLRGADLRFADLRRADLTEAVLQYANMDKVDLDDRQRFWANMSGGSIMRSRHMASVPTSIPGDVQHGSIVDQMPPDSREKPTPPYRIPPVSSSGSGSPMLLASIALLLAVLTLFLSEEEPTAFDMFFCISTGVVVLIIVFLGKKRE